jgi:hypothetical protein
LKGLELAQEYYNHLGEPMLRREFGGLVDRLAAGLAGPGSECFGFDDEISRDHDWGPAFCLWLTSDDYQKYGKELQKAYDRLPPVFMGFGPRRSSPGEEFRVGVCTITTFYTIYTGLNHIPSALNEWSLIPESSLATCTNGRVFSDPLGEFSRWRQALLAFYPEDILLKKIASRCFTMAQAGQYNLPRSLKRGELFAATWAVTQFCADMMSLVFLINRRYAPFQKWLHRAVRELTVLGEWTHSVVTDLISPADISGKPAIIENACDVIIRELRSRGLSDASSDFLLEHAYSIHSHIKDTGLRQRFSVVY